MNSIGRYQILFLAGMTVFHQNIQVCRYFNLLDASTFSDWLHKLVSQLKIPLYQLIHTNRRRLGSAGRQLKRSW